MKLKKLVVGVLCSALVMTSAMPAAACTGVYVGSEESENGSTYMGRSEDMGYDYVKVFGVSEAKDYPADYVFTDAYGFSMPFGGHVYRYTYIKDSVEMGEASEALQPYAEAGQNEKGVSVSATVSTAYNEAVEKADPLVDTGICELSIGSILLAKSATAREAVELLGKIIDTYGSGECNQITISDPKECWYFEVVSGHQWAAIKLPKDKVWVNPNITMLGVVDVNDKENVIASKNLTKLAWDNNFLVTDEAGKIDVAKTYSDKNSGKGQYERYMQGMFYINKAEAEKIKMDMVNVDNNSKESPISLLHDADRKMSTLDIFHLLSTRGEGTPYAQDEGKTGYSIGNQRQAECHVFETRENMPTDLATIQWQTVCPSEYSIYLPYYSAMVTSVMDKYSVESAEYVDNSMFWTFAKIYELSSADRKNSGAAVKAYFETYQKSLIEQQKAVDEKMQKLYAASPESAAVVANVVSKKVAEQTYDVATKVKKELEAYVKAGKTDKPFALSSAVKAVMPEYVSLVEKYSNQDELVKELNSQIEAGQKELFEAKEQLKQVDNAFKNYKRTVGVKATTVTASAKAAKGSVKVSYKKSGSYAVDTYRIYRASKKDGTYKMVKEVKASEKSATLSTKGLKKGSTYYYKVRGLRTIDGKKVYTKYSAQVKAVVK